MRPALISLATLALWTGMTCAGLFPTQPIAKTIFYSGAWNNVTWIDTESKPHLHELGGMLMELWTDADLDHSAMPKYVTTLASEVDPRAMYRNVYFPSEPCGKAPKFVIRFLSATAPKAIYTADFHISCNGTASSDKLRQGPPANASTLSVSSSSATGSMSMSGLPNGGNNDLVTVTMETTASSSPTLAPSGSMNSDAATTVENDALGRGRHVRRTNTQFNVIFVFFPALFGLALAL
ncbi:hypothetical protein M0805_008697 [Coniferiporia weirii]|nr:hypothetical protein M0805_008697 [Coniferiporia weirii]